MYNENPYYEEIDNWVTVWIGDLNANELDDYLNEPGGAGFDEPISAFSKDLGTWYDHDFLWAEGHQARVTIKELCELNGIKPPEFIDEIIDRSGGNAASSMIVLWNARVIDRSPREFAKGRLRCIGSWNRESPITD